MRDSNAISDAATDHETEQTPNTESQIRQAGESRRKAVLLLENGRNRGEHQVQIPVRHGCEQRQEKYNWRREEKLDGARER